MKTKFFRTFDYFLLLCVFILVTTGIMFIYSSAIDSEGVINNNFYFKQMWFAVTGFLLLVGVSSIDYRRLDRYMPFIYGFLVFILVYTRLLGTEHKGAKSWIGFGSFGLQPSEFCKVLYILFLAWYLDRSKNDHPRKRFLISLVIFLVPTGLILIQPDMGTAMVYIPIFLLMCFVAGVPLRYIFIIFAGGMLTVIFAVLPIYQTEIAHSAARWISVFTNTKLSMVLILAAGAICLIGIIGMFLFPENKYYYWIAYFAGIIFAALILSKVCAKVLKPYQIKRLIVFIDPNSDPRGAGWNIIQSKVAIGSGNWFGRGFLNGTQSHLRFLPEQHTDFIFSILAEEFGFVGCMMIYLIYFGMLFRMVYILRSTNNDFGFYIVSGVLAMFFFHFIVNVGMVMGIMPITGIPLLFCSYGGSSLWTAMICIGLVMSVNSHKFEL